MSLLKFFLIGSVFSLFTIPSEAQINRKNVTRSNPYRSNYQRMVAGSFHTLEIREGNLWAWGRNSEGQLGDGTNVDKNSPVQIGSDDKWVCVSARTYHSIGLKSDGTLWSWGANLFGQLGDGTYVDKNVPVQIGLDKNWVSISYPSAEVPI